MKSRIPSRFVALATTIAVLPLASPALAQMSSVGPEGEPTAYDGDWLSVGAGVMYGPSYDGSDDYVLSPAPIVQGNIKGVGISPRPAGFALDFIPNPDEGVGLALGTSFRLRTNRSSKVTDEVVKLVERDTALEVGPTAGITIPKVLHGYDSLSLGVDVRWDVLGAHDGMVVAPSVSYFTPLSRGTAVLLTLDAEYGNGKFMDYYYSVDADDALISGLPQYQADSGFTRAGATLIGGIDLNGDLTDGGFALVFVGSYSRMLGDAKDSPYTSIRGSADQWMGAVGLGYTF